MNFLLEWRSKLCTLFSPFVNLTYLLKPGIECWVPNICFIAANFTRFRELLQVSSSEILPALISLSAKTVTKNNDLGGWGGFQEGRRDEWLD